MICNNYSTRNRRGFTLLETLIGGMIFGIIVIASFSLYKYMIQISVDSRHAANVQSTQTTAFDMVNSMIQLEGWTTFLDHASGGNRDFAFSLRANPENDSVATYAIDTTNTNATVYPAPSSNETYQWGFSTEMDSALGPYLQKIEYNGSTYTLTFSKNIQVNTALLLNQILPFVNNPTKSWKDASYTVSTNQIVITPGTVTIDASDRIKPSADITDADNNSDVTYTHGVQVPTVSGTSYKGYPQLARVTVTISTTDSTYRASRYIRYQE